MRIKLDRDVLILIVFFSLLGLVLGSKFSSYNYLYIFIGFIFIFKKHFFLNKKIFLNLIILLFSFVIVLLFKNDYYIFFFIEYFNFATILILLYAAVNYKSEIVYLKSFFIFSLFYIIVYFLVYIFFSAKFIDIEDGRYTGLLGSTNFSSSFVCILLFFLNEYFKKIIKKRYSFFLITFISLWLLLLFITKSRTLLLAFPYWSLQLYYVLGFHKNKIKLFFFVPIILVLSSLLISTFDFEIISEDLRLIEDSSFLTREKIYNTILQKINNSYYIIPNGFNDANSFVQSLTKMKNFSVHNDYLKYWNDLGLFFFIIIIMIFKIIKNKINIDFLFILLFLLTLSFHNILFSIIIWLPLFYIFNLVFNKFNKI